MGNSQLFDYEPTGNDFIRALVKVILDEWRIVGNGEYMKKNHEKIVDFKYPQEIEESFNFEIGPSAESNADLLDMCRKTIAYSLKTNHPHYMNSLYGGVDQFGIAGAWLTDALNSSAAVWECSPVFAVIERHIIEFMGKMTGFNEPKGLFCPGGSMANCYAMMLARHKVYPDVKEHGIFGKTKLALFVSDQSHYSFGKMSIMLGHGTESVIRVRTDVEGRMIPTELEAAIIESKKNGYTPYMVAATAGTTVFGSFDPLVPLGQICRLHNLWFHVDGALGGTWLFSKKYQSLLAGLDQADSFTWDLHKMASVPIYCSLILINNKQDLFTEAFSLNAAYLFQADKYYDKGYDAGDQSIQCTRKVEAFKLFLFLKAHGLDEIQRFVDNVFDMSRYFEQEITTRPNFRLLFPKFESNNICFYFIPDKYLSNSDSLNREQHSKIVTELKRRMMEAGVMMVAYQTIDEKHIPACFRLTISALPVYTKDDILFIIHNFEKLGKEIVVQ